MNSLDDPKVSVIIPCHNVSRTIRTQLDALCRQEDAPPFEVIVVDNRSADNLQAIVREYARAPARVRFVSASNRLGTSYARNVGARHAMATRLMFCDGDDVVSSRWIYAGERAFDVAEVWTGSAIAIPDSDFEEDAESMQRIIDRLDFRYETVESAAGPFPVLMGGNFGITKRLFNVLGGFDGTFPRRGEDNDFAIRLTAEGYHLVEAPDVRLAYRCSTTRKVRYKDLFRDGFAHAKLATRHRLWRHSPARKWWFLLPRCAGSALRMALHRTSPDWDGLIARTINAAGITLGALWFRVLRRIPQRDLGRGFKTDQTGAARQ